MIICGNIKINIDKTNMTSRLLAFADIIRHIFLLQNSAYELIGSERKMFVLSMRMSKIKVIGAMLIVFVIAIGCVFYIKTVANVKAKDSGTTVNLDGKISYVAKSAQDKIKFINSFGWQVSDEPKEIVEVVIPNEFDDVYNQYNEIQKQQGLNLEKYKGKRVKRWTYTVTNYPDVPDNVVLNLLVYDNRIIGGDVSCIKLDGFMHGFDLNKKSDA